MTPGALRWRIALGVLCVATASAIATDRAAAEQLSSSSLRPVSAFA